MVSVAFTVPFGLLLQRGSPPLPGAGATMPVDFDRTMILFFDSSSGSWFLIITLLAETGATLVLIGVGVAVIVEVAVPTGVPVAVAVAVPAGMESGLAGSLPLSSSSRSK